MKRQFVIGRITVQRFASKQMRAKHAEDSNARFDTASFFAVRLGLVPPRDYLDRFVAPRRPWRNVRLKIFSTLSSCLHIRIPLLSGQYTFTSCPVFRDRYRKNYSDRP